MIAFPVVSGPIPAVPVEAQLCVRDATGDLVPFDAISFQEVRPAPGTAASFSAAIPVKAIRNGGVWLISGTRFDEHG